jgi:hypothetical protein
MTTIYRTVVVHLPPTPLGLVPASWHIEHRCTVCHDNVPTAELIDHARRHADPSPATDSADGRRGS